MVINPKCVAGSQQFAVNNRGQVVPCCHVDNALGYADETIQALAEASNIDDFNCIDDIIHSKIWYDFYLLITSDDLSDVPKPCQRYCGTYHNDKHTSETMYRRGNIIYMKEVE